MPGMDEISMIEGAAGNIGAEAVGIGQFISGLTNEKKDKAALAALHPAFYKIQSEYFQNRNISEQQAGQGLPSAQRDYMTQGAERGLGAGIDAILRGGGGVNDASLLLSQYNQQIGKIGAEDAAQHIANLEYFKKANADLAGEKTKQWAINEYQPYEAKLKELKQNVQTDEQNKWGGLTSAVSSMIGAGTASSNKSLMNKLFAKPSPDGSMMSVQDPYSATSGYQAPKVANTGGAPGSPAGNVGYIDPNLPPQGIQSSPLWMGDVTN
jgi:hypothetical protein